MGSCVIKRGHSRVSIEKCGIHEAIESNNYDKFTTALHAFDPETLVTQYEWSLLHYCAWHGRYELIELLLSSGYGGFLNKQDVHGDSPLHLAGVRGH
jgi:ankyrin repeat protein